MAFPPNEKWFQKIIEDQKRIEKILNPIPDSLLQYQKLLDSVNFSALESQRSILETTNITNCLSIAGISDDYLMMQQQIQNSLGSISSFTKELDFLKESTMFDSIVKSQDKLYRLQEQLFQTRKFIDLPSFRIESVLAAAEATSRIFQPNDFFSDFTLSSVLEYQSFVDRQYKLIQHENEIIADRRMHIAELSGRLFEGINASLDIGVALSGDEEIQTEEIDNNHCFESGIYGHVNQHLGFVYSGRYDGELEASFNNSIPARISYLGYAITEKIYQINTICENNGHDQIFKPTSRTMRACATLPSLIVKSEANFYFLIDHLFFLLYEGSGTAKRLIPIVNDSFLEPLWKVKHLRLSARHDIDHGSPKEIEKKRVKIGNAFLSLIAKPLPIKHGDWQKAQLQIYTELDLMLKRVILEVTKTI